MSDSRKTIWYINPYGGGPEVGRLMRPWHLATNWQSMGHDAVVFVARNHHLLSAKPPLPADTMVQGVRYVGLAARAYEGNGLGRILNMFDACASLWRMRKGVGSGLPKPDAIIVSSPHPFMVYPARALARKFGAKLIFEVRDLWPLSITAINGTSTWHPFVWLTALTERFAYSRADAVVSLLPGVERYMRDRNMRYQRFACIPNGFETDKTEARKPVSQKGLRILAAVEGWKERGLKILVHPGAMGPPNALDRLLEALAHYRRDPSVAPLAVLLLGDGVSRKALAERAAQLGLHDIMIEGPVSKAETKHIVGRCDFGYCGGKPNDAVYRYGISLNKMIDFGEIGLPMLLPFDALLSAPFANYPLLVKCAGGPDDIAFGLKQMVHMRPDPVAAESLVKGLSYDALAAAYVDVIQGT